MTLPSHISAYVSRLVSKTLGGLCLAGCLITALPSHAQGFLKMERDSVALFQGISVSADLAGAAMMVLSDYGQYEGAVRVNLHNQYFPVVEAGYGRADHENDEVTGLNYKTAAPYFRVGCDFNIMKNKHTGNRVLVGLRYGFTSYKVDIDRENFADPIWQWDTHYAVKDERCSQHWAEVIFALDAKVTGPLHLGWSFRYRRRIAHNDGTMGKTWYVPGYGTQDGTKLGLTFQVSIDI